MKNTKKGFTLIELLVVIAIIGILSSIVLVSLSTARSKGKDAAIQGELSQLRSAAEIYANGNGYANLFTNNNSWASNDPSVQAILTGINNQTTTHTAVSSATGWAAQALLTSGTNQYVCVDYTGQTKPGNTALAANSIVCP